MDPRLTLLARVPTSLPEDDLFAGIPATGPELSLAASGTGGSA